MITGSLFALQDLTAAHLAATEKLEEAVAEAEERCKEEKAKSTRMLEAAATGQFPASPVGPAALAETNGDTLQCTIFLF